MKYSGWDVSGYDRQAAVGLVRSGFNPILAALLASRGIKTVSETKKYLSDDISDIPDPMYMADMDKAAERIRTAVEQRELSAVLGDYDVDGITAGCLMTRYLRSKGLNCELIIPEKREEGYGISKKVLDEIASKGVTLAVSVDCGITSHEEAKYAKELGIDLIITDHHECRKELPAAAAVVNPKRADCGYPESMLAGVGVAFLLVCACEGKDNSERLINEYGDLAALGTIADVMPVMGVNRILIKHGINLIHRGSRPGIRMLADASGIDVEKLSVAEVGFGIAPRLNAAGRMGKASTAVRLLMSETDAEAKKYADELCELNTERRRIEGDMFDEALKLAAELPDLSSPLVLASENWYLGVAGIVASRLAEKLSRPAVVICLSDGVGRGSCRSYGDYNIHAALDCHRDLLLAFGGHEMAAGLTIEQSNIEELALRLSSASDGSAAAGKRLSVDFEVIKPGLLTLENVAALSLLEPFGNGNPPPVLCFRGALIESAFPLSGGKHSKFRIYKNGESFDAVFFGKTFEELQVKPGDSADLAFMPQINEYRGRQTVQLYLSDMRVLPREGL